MFGNVNGCARITSYAAALGHWNQTPEPKSRRRGNSLWSARKRPLDSARKWHYRLEEGDGYFDVCLYHTTMARFHAPLPDGSYRVQYTSHDSNLSGQFMWSVLNSGRTRTEITTEGKRVIVPVAGNELGTTLWYQADGRLIVEKSSHAVVNKMVASDTIKAWRKDMRKNVGTLLELLSLRIPELDGERHVSVNQWVKPGAPFSSVDGKYIRTIKNTGWEGGKLHEGAAQAIAELYEACAAFIVDKRVYGATPPSWGRKQVKERTALTPAAVRSSVLRQLDGLFPHWALRETAVPQPLFQETLPSHWRF